MQCLGLSVCVFGQLVSSDLRDKVGQVLIERAEPGSAVANGGGSVSLYQRGFVSRKTKKQKKQKKKTANNKTHKHTGETRVGGVLV